MRRVHLALGPLAAAWLFCQLAAVALTPVAFWVSSADAHLAECTCIHGADAACPMHHKPAPGSTICVMQSTSDQATVLLTSLFGLVGLMPGSSPVIDRTPSERFAAIGPQMTAARPLAPDPPPPRA